MRDCAPRESAAKLRFGPTVCGLRRQRLLYQQRGIQQHPVHREFGTRKTISGINLSDASSELLLLLWQR